MYLEQYEGDDNQGRVQLISNNLKIPVLKTSVQSKLNSLRTRLVSVCRTSVNPFILQKEDIETGEEFITRFEIVCGFTAHQLAEHLLNQLQSCLETHDWKCSAAAYTILKYMLTNSTQSLPSTFHQQILKSIENSDVEVIVKNPSSLSKPPLSMKKRKADELA